MSCSEDETNVASVLSQMSQTTQPLENLNNAQHIDSSVIAHECDVETSLNQGKSCFDFLLQEPVQS